MLEPEIESYIESISPQMVNGLSFVEVDNWVSDPLSEKMHFDITKRNVAYAYQLQSDAIKFNNHNEPEVKACIASLLQFFEIYKDRFNSYNELTKDLLFESATKSKAKRDALARDMQQQSEITKHFSELATIVKKISLLSSDDRVVIPTHNDVPIPLLMADQVEEIFPQVKNFLERKDAEHIQTERLPTKSERLDTEVSPGPEEEEA